jgi:hypothetical protein
MRNLRIRAIRLVRSHLVCPCCQARLNIAVPERGDSAPTDGDGNVCGECGAFSVFVVTDGALSLRPFTEADRADCDPETWEALSTAQTKVRRSLAQRN